MVPGYRHMPTRRASSRDPPLPHLLPALRNDNYHKYHIRYKQFLSDQKKKRLTETDEPIPNYITCIFRWQSAQRAVRAQVSADLEERKWIAPHHIGATLTYRSTPQGQYTQTLPLNQLRRP